MRQTDKSLQSEKFKQVVGGLGEPLGKSPAPDRIRSPRDPDTSFPCWPGSGYFRAPPRGVLSTLRGHAPSYCGTPDRQTAVSPSLLCPLWHSGTRPPPCWRQSNAYMAATAPWVPRGCPCAPPGPPAHVCHSGPFATVRAASSIAPPRARVSGVSAVVFAGADQGVTPSRPLARQCATR